MYICAHIRSHTTHTHTHTYISDLKRAKFFEPDRVSERLEPVEPGTWLDRVYYL